MVIWNVAREDEEELRIEGGAAVCVQKLLNNFGILDDNRKVCWCCQNGTKLFGPIHVGSCCCRGDS